MSLIILKFSFDFIIMHWSYRTSSVYFKMHKDTKLSTEVFEEIASHCKSALSDAYFTFQKMFNKRQKSLGCTSGSYRIIICFTSNVISSGLREQIKFLAQHKMIDAVVTTAGGVEEDVIKCIGGDTFLGKFNVNGSKLRTHGLNRVGNLLIPNSNYAHFEDFMQPIFDSLSDSQVAITPSELVDLLGKSVNSEDCIYHWCHKNSIPVFCPAITDGSIGDMMFFYNYKRTRFAVDTMRDMRKFTDFLTESKSDTGLIILGSGLPCNHVLSMYRVVKMRPSDILQISTTDMIDPIIHGIARISRFNLLHSEASLVLPLFIAGLIEKNEDRKIETQSCNAKRQSYS